MQIAGHALFKVERPGFQAQGITHIHFNADNGELNSGAQENGHVQFESPLFALGNQVITAGRDTVTQAGTGAHLEILRKRVLNHERGVTKDHGAGPAKADTDVLVNTHRQFVLCKGRHCQQQRNRQDNNVLFHNIVRLK